MTTNNRASVHFEQMEPDRARTRCLNLLGAMVPFLVEIDAQLIKDMVVVHRGAVEFEQRYGFEYLPTRATSFDDAAQYLVNLIRSEMSFQVDPHQLPDHREWVVTVEIPLGAHRLEPMSERNR